MSSAIVTRALRKVYPLPPKAPPNPAGGIVAVDGLDLDIAEGELFGVLGPNGAGKTTTIGILTTRVRLTAGEAIVAGADVVRESSRLRQRIRVVPQRADPDRRLNVVEKLIFHASYFPGPRAPPGSGTAEARAGAPGGVPFGGPPAPRAEPARARPGVSTADPRGVLPRAHPRRAGEIIPDLLAAGEANGRHVKDIPLSRP